MPGRRLLVLEAPAGVPRGWRRNVLAPHGAGGASGGTAGLAGVSTDTQDVVFSSQRAEW